VRRNLFILCLGLIFSACATPPQDAISVPPPVELTLSQVRSDVARYVNQRVRWGGTIVAVENRSRDTYLEIVARTLDTYGRPRPSGESLGRFIARADGFLDPAIYSRNREITVAGTVEAKLTRAVGEYPYDYVVVHVDTRKLWEPRLTPPYYRDPFYDPFYDPFWPGRPGPWYPWYPWPPGYPYYPYWR
jgi:outer membrane lipoprotein